MSPLNPSLALLCKLGSIAVHAGEMLSPDGHNPGRVALQQLLTDDEVKRWLAQMDEMAMLPKKRAVESNVTKGALPPKDRSRHGEHTGAYRPIEARTKKERRKGYVHGGDKQMREAQNRRRKTRP